MYPKQMGLLTGWIHHMWGVLACRPADFSSCYIFIMAYLLIYDQYPIFMLATIMEVGVTLNLFEPDNRSQHSTWRCRIFSPLSETTSDFCLPSSSSGSSITSSSSSTY